MRQTYAPHEDTRPDIQAIPAITQRYRANLDFPYSMPLQDFLEHLDKIPGTKIMRWATHGPGGGNPCIELEFRDHAAGFECIRLHYPDDTPEFWASLLSPAH